MAQPDGKNWVVEFVNPTGREPTSGELRTYLEKMPKFGKAWGVTKQDYKTIEIILSKAIKSRLK